MVNIKKQVDFLIHKFGTNDPFEIANSLNIVIQFGKIDFEGCYMFLKNHKYIFLNQNLDKRDMRLVMAHELAHALLHPKENCYFMRNKTLLLTSKTEIEANTFAMELLISDQDLEDCKEYSLDQLSSIFGYHKKLIELRIKNY